MRKLTEEHKKKLSAAKKGRTLTEEHKKKISKGGLGKKRTDEQKLNYSKSKLGDKNPSKQKWVKDKISMSLTQTYLENPKIKDSIANTLKQYFVDNPEVKLKMSNRRKKLYENPEERNKTRDGVIKAYEEGRVCSTFSKSSKPIFLNDSDLYYQGSYELDFLNNFNDKIKIENGKIFKYKIGLCEKKYISDFYLPDFNLIIEIKSEYTFSKSKGSEYNNLKRMSALEAGFNFLFIVDKQYDEFLNLIKPNV